jgi:hypothetical protein
MGIKDRSLIEQINPTFFTLYATATHQCLSAWKTREFRVPSGFGSGGGAQRKCDTRNIHHAVNNACMDVFCHLDTDFRSSLPEVQAKQIDSSRSMIRLMIHSTGMDQVMAQPHNDQARFVEDFL